MEIVEVPIRFTIYISHSLNCTENATVLRNLMLFLDKLL